MNTVARSGIARQRNVLTNTRLLPLVRLPIYLRLALLMLSVMAIIVAGWIVVIRQDIQLSSPFSAYSEIFPGQARNSLINQDFSCAIPVITPSSSVTFCALTPKDSAFWRVSLVLKNRIVQRADFEVHEKSILNLGDLTLLWGRPEVRLHQRLAVFEWKKLGINGMGPAENPQVNYFMPVRRLTFRNSGGNSKPNTYEGESTDNRLRRAG